MTIFTKILFAASPSPQFLDYKTKISDIKVLLKSFNPQEIFLQNSWCNNSLNGSFFCSLSVDCISQWLHQLQTTHTNTEFFSSLSEASNKVMFWEQTRQFNSTQRFFNFQRWNMNWKVKFILTTATEKMWIFSVWSWVIKTKCHHF